MIWSWHEDRASMAQELADLELQLELAWEDEDRADIRRRIKELEERLEIESEN